MNHQISTNFATFYDKPLMSNTSLPLIAQWQDSPQFLQNIGDAAKLILDPITIDKGYYPIKEMGELAKLGAFASHLDSQNNRFKRKKAQQKKVAEKAVKTSMTSCPDR